jgi:superfamily II DNA or RNA helicase
MAEHVLRTKPVVACSRLYDPNDPDPADAIEQFARGHDPWIVAVNMISEGVDIRRLRAVVYLTNRMTLLSFRQIVGRVVRSDLANEDDHGRVYLPADRRLLEMAREITNEVDLLPPPMIIELDQPGQHRVTVRDVSGTKRVPFEVLGTSGEQGAIFDTSGNLADAALVNQARRFIRMNKLTGTDAESLALLARQKPALLAQLRDCGEDK